VVESSIRKLVVRNCWLDGEIFERGEVTAVRVPRKQDAICIRHQNSASGRQPPPSLATDILSSFKHCNLLESISGHYLLHHGRSVSVRLDFLSDLNPFDSLGSPMVNQVPAISVFPTDLLHRSAPHPSKTDFSTLSGYFKKVS
jgi:hypothetical protein